MSGARSCGRLPLAASALLLALATIAGAVGAHALRTRWSAERLQVYDTAVRYQFYHSLGLLGMGLLLSRDGLRVMDPRRAGPDPGYLRVLRAAAGLVLAGIVLFSGSLYALTLGAPRWMGILTPVGGVALIGGWLLFAYGICRA